MIRIGVFPTRSMLPHRKSDVNTADRAKPARNRAREFRAEFIPGVIHRGGGTGALPVAAADRARRSAR
ncbi:hypothetical protein GCM10009834_51480 [Streptomonospora arabica]